jgi:hypothetical protein
METKKLIFQFYLDVEAMPCGLALVSLEGSSIVASHCTYLVAADETTFVALPLPVRTQSVHLPLSPNFFVGRSHTPLRN